MKILKYLSSMVVILALCMTSFAAEREEKVVYHVSEDANASMALRNARNHMQQSPKAKIVIVALGSGIDFLLDGAQDKNGNPFDIWVQELAAKKVEFRVCNNTLMGRKIDKSKVIPEASIVPSGVAEISRLQFQEGFGYIKP